MKVELGKTYRDKITGLEGVCVGRYEYLNGCVRVCLQPRELKDGVPVEGSVFDVEQLDAVDVAPVEITRKPAGGPRQDPAPRENPTR